MFEVFQTPRKADQIDEKEKAQLEEMLKSGFQRVKQVVELRAIGEPDEPPPTPSISTRLSTSSRGSGMHLTHLHAE